MQKRCNVKVAPFDLYCIKKTALKRQNIAAKENRFEPMNS
jgi:hypothetical protein